MKTGKRFLGDVQGEIPMNAAPKHRTSREFHHVQRQQWGCRDEQTHAKKLSISKLKGEMEVTTWEEVETHSKSSQNPVLKGTVIKKKKERR